MAPIAVASVMQFVLAEAILLGKCTGRTGARKKKTGSSSGNSGRRGRGDLPSSSELVPLRRDRTEEGDGRDVNDDNDKVGPRRNPLSATTTTTKQLLLLPPSPFEAPNEGAASGSSPPRLSRNAAAVPLSRPPLDRDCVSIDMEPEGEEETESERERARGKKSSGADGGRSAPAKLLTRSSGSKHWKAVADGLEEAEEEVEANPPSASTSPRPFFLVRFASAAAEATRAAASPPAVASLLGLLVGSLPVLRALFFDSSKETEARTPPLALLASVCEILGGAMIPCLIIILGAELASRPESGEEGEGEGGGSSSSPSSSPPSSLPPRAIAAALAARLLLMPCLGAAFLSLATRSGLLSPGNTSPPEPLFRVVALLAWGTPAAAMLSTLCSRLSVGSSSGGGGSSNNNNVDGLGKKMAVLLSWNYAASAATLPLLVSAAMAVMT